MKRIIILLFLAFVCTDIKAQIYHSEVCFYIEAGESLTENTTITTILFDGEILRWKHHKKSTITAKLKESADFCDDLVLKNGGKKEYDSDLSTYSRKVYSEPWYGQGVPTYNNPWGTTIIGKCFYAFSTDLSSFISWCQEANSEKIERKTHYKRIDKSELMPNENLYNFLND